MARKNISLDPPGKLAVILEIRRSTINLASSLEQGLPLLRGQKSGQPLFVSPNQFRSLEEERRTFEWREIFPLRLSILGRLQRVLYLLPIRLRHGGDHYLSGGVVPLPYPLPLPL